MNNNFIKIKNKSYIIRNKQTMIGKDLKEVYQQLMNNTTLKNHSRVRIEKESIAK